MKPPEPSDKLYKYHVKNLQEIDRAMERVARSLRFAIAQDDKITVSSFMPLYALLLGAWAECRLRKLIYEPKGFDDSERELIRGESQQFTQWQKAIEVAFRRQYRIPKAPLTANVLPHSAYSKYETLSKMLNEDLSPIIELRNKLAQGQWVYPLDNHGNRVSQKQMAALKTENFLSLHFKKNLLESLSAIIHDLVVSKPTFERDFDDHFRIIVETRRNLKNRKYEAWAKNMQEKYQRGREKRLQLINH